MKLLMTHLGKFVRLTWPEKGFLIQAYGLMGFIILALRLCPFATLQKLLTRLANRPSAALPTRRPSAERIVWAVQAASGWLPRATCLPQALAGHFMLTRHGYPATIQLGAAKTAGGKIEAHAWVTMGREILIGRLSDLERFISLTPAARKGAL